jgi:hypothetical protein
MTLLNLHPQDVLAAIRKVYGSAAAFERAHRLPNKSVHDVMRGRPSKRVTKAIERLLAKTSDNSDSSRVQQPMHSQNSEAA